MVKNTKSNKVIRKFHWTYTCTHGVRVWGLTFFLGGGGGGLIRGGVRSAKVKRRNFDYFLKTVANVSSYVIVVTVIMLKLIWNCTLQGVLIHYLNRLVAHRALMLYGPNLKGSRFESVASSILIRTHNFNSYLSQKLSQNVVVSQWQLLRHSLFQSNFLWK